MKLRALLFIPILTLAGCLFGPDGTSDELSSNRNRWESQGWDSYEYWYQNTCFCPVEYVEPVTVLVRGGRVISARVVATGVYVPAESLDRYKTVDQAFALVDDAIRRGAARVDVSYDAAFGYPTKVFIDYSAATADEEKGLAIRDLRPLRD